MHRSVLAAPFALAALGMLGACNSPLVTDSRTDLLCDPAAPAPGAIHEVATFLGRASTIQLAPCGTLTYIDSNRDLYRVGPDLATPELLRADVVGVVSSRRGDQLWIVDQDNESTWMDLATGDTVHVATNIAGFVRFGEDERPWACAGGELGLVEMSPEAPGIDVQASGVICDRAFVASQAPVIGYADVELAELHVVDLASREVLQLGEVPYIAVANDSVRLSRDGRILYHQPVTSPIQRVGIFDLGRDDGDRLLGAPETSLGNLVEARATGHVAALSTSDGTVIIQPDAGLNFYPGAQLASLARDGSHALLLFASEELGGRWDLEIADLARDTLVRAGTLPGPASYIVRSPDGRHTAIAASFFGPMPEGVHQRFLYDSELSSLTPWDEDRELFRPLFVANDGTLILATGDNRIALIDAAGVHRRTWRQEWWWQGAFAARSGVVLRMNNNLDGSNRLIHAATDGSETVLYEGNQLWIISSDEAGDRIAFATIEPDEVDPTVQRTRIFAGAI